MNQEFPTNNTINQALLTQIMNEIYQGNFHRCIAMGINEEVIQLINRLTPQECSKLISTPVTWARFSIDTKALKRLIHQSIQDKQLNELIDKAILLGASNKILNDFFGIFSAESAIRRKLLGLNTSKGRLADVPDNKRDDIWREWRTFLKHDENHSLKLRQLEKMIEIAEKYDLNLSSLWHEIWNHTVKGDTQ